MKFNAIRLTVPSLFLLAVFSNELPAQTTTSGALIGVVTDSSNAVVPDAVVELRDANNGAMQAAKTDGDGVFRFFFLAPGRYTLSVSHALRHLRKVQLRETKPSFYRTADPEMPRIRGAAWPADSR